MGPVFPSSEASRPARRRGRPGRRGGVAETVLSPCSWNSALEPVEPAVVLRPERHAEEEGEGGGDGHGGGGHRSGIDAAALAARRSGVVPGGDGSPMGATGRARRRRGLLEALGDAGPHALGGPLAAVGEEGGGLPVGLHLGPAAGAAGQVGLDDVALVVVDGVEGEGAEQLLDVLVGEAASWRTDPGVDEGRRKRRRPERMRLFTVPSGSSRRVATSR